MNEKLILDTLKKQGEGLNRLAAENKQIKEQVGRNTIAIGHHKNHIVAIANGKKIKLNNKKRDPQLKDGESYVLNHAGSVHDETWVSDDLGSDEL